MHAHRERERERGEREREREREREGEQGNQTADKKKKRGGGGMVAKLEYRAFERLQHLKIYLTESSHFEERMEKEHPT